MSRFPSFYRTVSFWTCCTIVLLNLPVVFIAKQTQDRGMMGLAITSMLAGFVGALVHWVLDRLFSKE